jgi:hypothetical protein
MNQPQTAQQGRTPPNAVRSEQREPARPERLQRVKTDTNPHHIDPSSIPDGMVYQWNTVSIYGSEDGKIRQQAINMARQHWTPVPASRHPEIATDDDKGRAKGRDGKSENAIIIGGLRLDERPAYLSEESRREERQAAHGQVADKFRSLHAAPDGQAPRDNKGAPMVKMKRDYDLAVPDDAA